MIINESYDKSLWLITYGDKKNRNMVVDYMNSIPDRLYDTMRMFANIACSCMKDNSFYLDKSNSVITHDGIMYWFRIDRYNFGLTLGYSIFDGHNYDTAWEMTIYPFEKVEKGNYNVMLRIENDNGMSEKDSIISLMSVDGNYFVEFPGKIIQRRTLYAEQIPQNLELSDLRKSNRLLVRKRVLSKNK